MIREKQIPHRERHAVRNDIATGAICGPPLDCNAPKYAGMLRRTLRAKYNAAYRGANERMDEWDSFPAGYRQAEAQAITAGIDSGESVSVVGLSGAGKSNLLGFLARQLSAALSIPTRRQVWAGIAVYNEGARSAAEKIRLARDAGVAGIALFSYDKLLESSGYRRNIRSWAFREPTIPTPMPWKEKQ